MLDTKAEKRRVTRTEDPSIYGLRLLMNLMFPVLRAAEDCWIAVEPPKVLGAEAAGAEAGCLLSSDDKETCLSLTLRDASWRVGSLASDVFNSYN
jgi:hypothetical protein